MLLVVHTTHLWEEAHDIESLSASSLHDSSKSQKGKGEFMKNPEMVRTTIDLANPPALTPAQIAELDALDAKPDSEIDYSDIPPYDPKRWHPAIRNPVLQAHQNTSTTWSALTPMSFTGCAITVRAIKSRILTRSSAARCWPRCAPAEPAAPQIRAHQSRPSPVA